MGCLCRCCLPALSDLPLFISDEFLIRELSRHGKVISPIKKILLGYKITVVEAPFSSQHLYMILNNRSKEFNYHFVVRVDDFDYVCSLPLHSAVVRRDTRRACPSRANLAPQTLAGVAIPSVEQPVPAARWWWSDAVERAAAGDTSSLDGAVI